MAATVIIDKMYGATLLNASVANMNFLGATGNVSSSGVTADHPITKPNDTTAAYSYENWHKLEVTALSTSTKVDNIQFWKSAGTLGAGLKIVSNVTASIGSISGTYAAQVVTSSVICSGAIKAADPATANVGISGVLAGALLTTGYSNFVVTQMVVESGAGVGATASCTFTWQYDEQ